MDQKFRSFFKNKWVIGTGIVLAVLFTAIFLFTQFFFQPWLRNKLQSETEENTEGIYKLHMGDFSASLLGGSLSIDNLALIPDTTRWKQLNEAGQPELTSRLTGLKASRLRLSGINYLGVLLNKPLKFSQVLLRDPVMHINQMKADTTDTPPLHRALEGPLRNMEIKKIRIENGQFSYKNDYRHKYNAAEVSGLHLEIKDIRLDSASHKAENRIFYARQFQASANKTNTLSTDGYNRLKTGGFTINSDSRQVSMKNVSVTPVYKPAELARRKGEATTWLALKVPEVLLDQVDLGALARFGNVAIGTITLKSPEMKTFKDKKNFPLKTSKPLPHDLIQQFKSGLAIGTIKISNMHIRIDELAEEAKRTGFIELRNLNATITNVTNDKKQMTGKNPAVINVSFSLMGKGNLNATIRLPLLNKNGYHTISGKVDNADLQALNHILEPAYFVSFKSGHIKSGTFNLELYRNTATGKVQLHYNEFEIDLLSKSEEKKQSLPKKVLSKVANKVVVKEENTPEDDGLRTADVNVSRQQKRSVFTYWKDCLEQGLIVSAGLGNFQPDK